MLAVTIHFDIVFVLMVVAIALFVLASAIFGKYHPKVRGWFLPIGLACFAAAALIVWRF